MNREKFFSKLTPKDYNNQLEKILEKKDFSTNAKNLLLSMLYKIEAAYKDYETVKVIVESKNEYIEKILKSIEKCKEIVIVTKANENIIEDEEEIKKERYIVNPLEEKIQLFYPNEKNLLYAISDLDSTSIYFTEEYNLCRVALTELLNCGENTNNVEVLRDFNGWSWAIQQDEIKNLWLNLIYQNLIYLIGFDEITKWIHQTEIANYVEVIEKILSEKYGEEISRKMLKLICKLSIIISVTVNSKERERLFQEKKYLQEELDRLNNKTKLLEEISLEKKKALKEIKEIDKILNSDELLQQEFTKRNEKLPEYNKIFSILHLTEILNKQRKKQLSIIEENNKLLEPRYFVQVKSEKEEQYSLLNTADLVNGKILDKETIIELQKLVIQCLEIMVEKAVEKSEIIDLIYMIRYYKFLPIEKEKEIRNVKELEKDLYAVQSKLITKAVEQKVLIRVTEDKTANEVILMSLFNTKIIKLENINMEITKENIKLYDDKILERTIGNIIEDDLIGENVVENIGSTVWDKAIIEEINKLNINELKVKMNKAFKIFV